MKKLYVITTLIAILIFVLTACEADPNENSGNASQNESSETVQIQESQGEKSNDNSSEPETSAPAPEVSEPEASEPEPEVSEPEVSEPEPEESLPEIFNTTAKTPDEILVPDGYEEILSLIEKGELKTAYSVLKEKKNDIYAKQLLDNFWERILEYTNNHCWYGNTDTERRIYTVNELGLTTKMVSSSKYYNNVTTYVYDEKGLLQSTSNNNGKFKYFYDDLGRRIKTVEEHDNGQYITTVTTTIYRNEKNGLIDKIEIITRSDFTAERIETKEYFYDKYGRKVRYDVSVNGEKTQIQTWEHDESGRLVKEATAFRHSMGETKVYSYNSYGFLIKIETCLGSQIVIEEYAYNDGGDVVLYIKERDGVEVSRYEYEYDEKGRLEKMYWDSTDALEFDYGITEYTYDEKDNLIKKTTVGDNDHSGKQNSVTEYGYNENSELIWENYSNGSDLWYKRTYKGYSLHYNENRIPD